MASMNWGKWVFTKEQLLNTPSRRCNIDYEDEIYYRQLAATLIQEMGEILNVTQRCMSTAIVYVHRFYMFHSFTEFHQYPIAACSLFLAAKVEEQPKKSEHVIRVSHTIIYKDQLDLNSEQCIEQARQELINNENILLQTLAFDVAIDDPHPQVLECCQHLFRASSSKDIITKTSYFMATNSLLLTTMCLQYKPTVVACVCIHLVCKWLKFEIPQSSEGKDWFWYVDQSVTLIMLEELTVEFLAIINKCPTRLKNRVMQQPGVNTSAMTDKNAPASSQSHTDPSSATAKPVDRVLRSQRRDKTGVTVPPFSSTVNVLAGHRPSVDVKKRYSTF